MQWSIKPVCENCAVPEGTRFHSPPYPALRLRLRAGVSFVAPTALDYWLANSTGKYQSSVLTHGRQPPSKYRRAMGH